MSWGRVALQTINIGLSITTEITSEVLNNKIQALQDKANTLQAKYAALGVDLKVGADFFVPIIAQMNEVTINAQEIDLITNKKIQPLIQQLKIDGNSIIKDVVKLPVATDDTSLSVSAALTWLPRVLVSISILSSFQSLAEGTRSYWSKSKPAVEKKIQDLKYDQVHPSDKPVSDVSNQIEMAEQIKNENEHAQAAVGEVTVLPEVPEIPKERVTKLEKLGAAFDTLTAAFTVVALAFTIKQYKTNKEEAEAIIDKCNTEISNLLANMDTITKEEVQFFKDIPSLFLFIKFQTTTVSQLAAYAEVIRVPTSPSQDKLSMLIDDVNQWHPFTDEEYTFMSQMTDEMDADEMEPVQQTRLDKLKASFSKLSDRLPIAKFQDAFTNTGVLYDQLASILHEVSSQLNYVQLMINAISTVKSEVADNAPFATIKSSVSSILSSSPTDDDIWSMIALFGTTADSYLGTNLTEIREKFTTLDVNAWNQFSSDLSKDFSG